MSDAQVPAGVNIIPGVTVDPEIGVTFDVAVAVVEHLDVIATVVGNESVTG